MRPRHVYIHVPFCARRCTYCDFAIAVRGTVPVADYLAALGRELDLRYVRGERWEADTLYFGGGTPSHLGGEGVARLMELVRDRVSLAAGAEVTLETNPDDVTPEAARAWSDAGVNRISLGVQSFHDAALKWMHRVHDADVARRAVATLREAGFANLSLDLIFALPESLGRDWRRDLEEALTLAPEHLSLYGLTVEEHTPLGRWTARGTVAEAPEERYEAEFLLAHDLATSAGMEHYEVSNFARPGRRSRHNSSYWRGVAYAGLGPGAHEFDGETRRWNVSAYAEWCRRLGAGDGPEAGSERLTDENRAAEAAYLGLRTSSGLRLCPDEMARAEPRLRRWIEAGWARLAGDGLVTLTPTGWLRLDPLAASLTDVRSC